MKVYKISQKYSEKYIADYDEAMQYFNDTIKEEFKKIKETKLSKEEFGLFLLDKPWNENDEIISRHYPFIFYKTEEKQTVCMMLYWSEIHYDEGDEWSICEKEIILEEVEIGR